MSGKKENDMGVQSKQLLDQGLISLAFMTRLPVPYREGSVAKAGWGFPIAGAIVGFLSGGMLWLAFELGLPAVIAAILALIVSAMVTGALHEDGFADCCDGLWGGITPERRLEIMRDSNSGAYGVLGLILNVALRVSAIALLADFWGPQPTWMMLVAIHATARAPLPLAMTLFNMAGKTGLAAMVGRPGYLVSAAAILFAMVLSWLSLNVTPIWMPLGLLAVALVSAGLIGLLARAKLGGINGDSLGGMEQVAEIACLLILLIVIGP